MVRILTNIHRRREVLLLGAFSVFCVALSALRIIRTDSLMYIFLVWNLFLAFVPYALGTFVRLNERVQKSRAVLVFVLGLWLLFFPNAPYILTDLIHLRHHAEAPFWYDLGMILCFSWAGLLYGLYSLRDIGQVAERWISRRRVQWLQGGLLFLAAFGVYLGRYQRWNSWDLLDQPFELLFDIANRVLHPLRYAQTWGMTLLFGLFLNVVFASLSERRDHRI